LDYFLHLVLFVFCILYFLFKKYLLSLLRVSSSEGDNCDMRCDVGSVYHIIIAELKRNYVLSYPYVV